MLDSRFDERVLKLCIRKGTAVQPSQPHRQHCLKNDCLKPLHVLGVPSLKAFCLHRSFLDTLTFLMNPFDIYTTIHALLPPKQTDLPCRGKHPRKHVYRVQFLRASKALLRPGFT